MQPPPQFQASQDSHELDKVSDFTHKEELKLDVMHGASANQSARVERQMETVTKAIHRQMVEQGHVRLEESQMTMQAESMAEANLAGMILVLVSCSKPPSQPLFLISRS